MFFSIFFFWIKREEGWLGTMLKKLAGIIAGSNNNNSNNNNNNLIIIYCYLLYQGAREKGPVLLIY